MMGLSNHEITLKSVLPRIKNPQETLASAQELLLNLRVVNHCEIEILDGKAVIVTERLVSPNLVIPIQTLELGCTLSIGLSVFKDSVAGFFDCLRRTDQAKYKAKQNGRNGL